MENLNFEPNPKTAGDEQMLTQLELESVYVPEGAELDTMWLLREWLSRKHHPPFSL